MLICSYVNLSIAHKKVIVNTIKKLFGKYLNIFQNFLPLYMQLYPEKYCKILIPYCNYDSSIIFYKNNYKYVILLSHNKNKLDFIHLI